MAPPKLQLISTGHAPVRSDRAAPIMLRLVIDEPEEIELLTGAVDGLVAAMPPQLLQPLHAAASRVLWSSTAPEATVHSVARHRAFGPRAR